MESNKLTKLNLMFDTFSVAYQLSSLTPLTVVDNSCPSSPVAKAKKSNLVGGGVPVEQDKLLMIHHQDNNRFIGVLSNPVEQKMSLEGIKTDEQVSGVARSVTMRLRRRQNTMRSELVQFVASLAASRIKIILI